MPNVFKINEFITMRLEGGRSNVYVKGELFRQCKYLLLNIPLQDDNTIEKIDSIDQAALLLDHSMEHRGNNYSIPPEMEFWGHCSNMQTWVEHNYDTRIFHHNLAFPLLKKLTDVGDPLAKKVFKEEIAHRLEQKYIPVIYYLIGMGYLKYLSEDEINSLDESVISLISELKSRLKIQNSLEDSRPLPTPETQDGIVMDLEGIERLLENQGYRTAIRELERFYNLTPKHYLITQKLKNFIEFFSLEELKDVFKNIGLKNQKFLQLINKLIHRKKIIGKVKEGRRITITEELVGYQPNNLKLLCEIRELYKSNKLYWKYYKTSIVYFLSKYRRRNRFLMVFKKDFEKDLQ